MVNFDYLYNPEVAKPYFDKNYLVDKKLGFQVIEKGTILPHVYVDGKWTLGKGGIVDSNGEFIKSSSVIGNSESFYTPPLESIQHSSETVIYLTIFPKVWGHVLTDNIRRLWFLNNDVFCKEFENCPIVYLSWKNDKKYYIDCMPDIMRFLEIIGVDINRLRPITQPTQFDKIILFDEAWNSAQKYVTNEYREMIERVRNFALKNRTTTSSKKLYFFYGKKQVGEERMAEYFKSKGYEIITHEKRSASFDEELNLIINAESFASPLGSCAHNSLFLRDNTEAIFIPRSFNAFTSYQLKIDQVCSFNANYIDSTLSVFNINHDSFCFIISKQLKKFFGDKWNGYEDEDFKNFLEYVNSPIRYGRAMNLVQEKGYGSVFSDFMEQLKQREDLIAAYNMPSDWDTFRSTLQYQTHVHMKGWRDGYKSENQYSNPLDQELEILAIQLNYPAHKVYYSVYFNDKEGWSAEVASPEMAGTVGKRKPIYGMRIRLDEAGAKEFDILYRMHKFDGEWTTWAKNGEELYSNGVKVNAIQIKLESIKTQPAKETQPQPAKETQPQPAKEVPKQSAKEVPKQPAKEMPTQFIDIQEFFMKNDDEFYLQVQRQDLTKII